MIDTARILHSDAERLLLWADLQVRGRGVRRGRPQIEIAEDGNEPGRTRNIGGIVNILGGIADGA